MNKISKKEMQEIVEQRLSIIYYKLDMFERNYNRFMSKKKVKNILQEILHDIGHIGIFIEETEDK